MVDLVANKQVESEARTKVLLFQKTYKKEKRADRKMIGTKDHYLLF